MAEDSRDAFNLTEKQRMQLMANLMIDKIKEERKQGWPSMERVQAENLKPSKYPPDEVPKIEAWLESMKNKYADKRTAEKTNKLKHTKK